MSYEGALIEYLINLQGESLMVVGWHQNGELEPLDTFIQEILEIMGI